MLLFDNKIIGISRMSVKVIFSCGIFLLSVVTAQALEFQKDKNLIIPDKIVETIKIDGVLSEKVWHNPGLLNKFLSFHPVYGEELDHKTEIWLTYDRENLYFAFKCFDSQPGKLKTQISKRDTISGNDCIGIALDTMNNKQSLYEFLINPSGIQEDGIESAVKGFDVSPDLVWESAGKIVEDGYIVEVKIPLESIRFKRTKEVKMGILFVRHINRFGEWGSWPGMKAGDSIFNVMHTIVYKNLEQGLKLEILPNFTYNSDQDRETDSTWAKSTNDKNFGVSIKYGITSSISAEATINPDFSQIESDAFQIDVNRRYPIFYIEKRPFFMEGTEALDFGLINGSMMHSAVHTRHIVDPDWAAKVSGTIGKALFTVLTASEKSPGLDSNSEGENTFWGIARGKYSLGRDNSLGFLYTGKYIGKDKNNVFGLDFQYRILNNTRFTLSYLNSNTSNSEEETSLTGNGINAMLAYGTKKIDLWGAYERYDPGFRMAAAFIDRVGISRFVGNFGLNFYLPQKGSLSWIRCIKPFLEYMYLHDLSTKRDDSSLGLGLEMNFSRRGSFQMLYQNQKEAWGGQIYDKNVFSFYLSLQGYKWLLIRTSFKFGDKIYYDPVTPFPGTGNTFTLDTTFQPGDKFSLNLGYENDFLKQKIGEPKTVYSVNIYNFLSAYQFNKNFYLRAALRYNDFNKKLLLDFLASYTLIPGTVVHIGYGLLYEDKKWEDRMWVPGSDKLINMRRNLFIKVSYLWRL